jgi:hypothetical protein
LPRVDAGNGQFQVSDWHNEGTLLVGTVDPAEGSGENPTVWLYDLDAGDYRYLAEGSSPTFMSDGRRILYNGVQQGNFFVVDMVTGESWPLASLPQAESIALSTDDRRIYIVRVDQEADIWMLELQPPPSESRD